MRVKISSLVGATLVLWASAATSQSFPCSSVAPEVREQVRASGACRDLTRDDSAPKEIAPGSPTVTVRLSDGTVVRVPREIGADINGGRATPSPKSAQAKKSQPSAEVARDSSPPAPRLNVPNVIGHSYDDAVRALTQFKVDRIETAGDAPRGQIIAQEPAPAARLPEGSTVSLKVSDGSLATKGTTAAPSDAATAVTPPATANSTTTTTTAPTPASPPTVPPESRGGPSMAFSADTALGLGAGGLLGLLVGSLLMRQRLLRSERATRNERIPATPDEELRQVELKDDGATETGATPEMSFAARLYPGEITIVLDPLNDSDQFAFESLGNQDA